MIDLHNAVRATHNKVVSVNGNSKEDITAYDIDGKQISIDWAKVDAWVDPNEYVYNRIAEYPSIGDQLDKIYHDGIDKWKEEMIKPIKDKYPKE